MFPLPLDSSVALTSSPPSISLKELVESMLQEGTPINGGGSFVFSQHGDTLVGQFLA